MNKKLKINNKYFTNIYNGLSETLIWYKNHLIKLKFPNIIKYIYENFIDKYNNYRKFVKFFKSNKVFISFYLTFFLVFLFIYIAIPNQYITKTIVKPITRLDFDNKIFELSIKHKYLGLEKEYFKKVFEDKKKVIIKIENVDSLIHNKPSPLVLFYDFFRIVEDQNYKHSKFQINFFENSFEYFL